MGSVSQVRAVSAVVSSSGGVRQLDLRPEPEEQITEEQAKDPARLARVLMKIIRDLSGMRRRWWPRYVDHEDLVVDGTGTTKYRLPHEFGGRVRWWPVDWSDSAAGPRLKRHADTDSNTLVLVSYTAGTVTVRVEETA